MMEPSKQDLKALQAEFCHALQQGLPEEAEALARQAVEAGADPLAMIQYHLVPTLTEIGRQFQAFEVFLPELMAAGDAAQAATRVLEAAIVASGQRSAALGIVVLGTVQGDIHDIGKNIVSTLLSSHGFKVVDLGRDVAPSRFLEAAQSEQAQIIAMSALMTTTRPATRSTLSLFRETGMRDRFRIIIGGGSIDQAWADEIGADGYAADAASAVELCKALLEPSRSA